jgi:hypothetical protein
MSTKVLSLQSKDLDAKPFDEHGENLAAPHDGAMKETAADGTTENQAKYGKTAIPVSEENLAPGAAKKAPAFGGFDG